eukprot:TRINITY_DN7855_c0_g1_i2.p1 TRINITY_DN7855_c0_g1~~TRINITY_DN7855_c0_g1_i2.p1  ORF type:complete len:248 (+),score=39.77 TRINITY_DN7855_c0_g1_i2:833-1576(+)
MPRGDEDDEMIRFNVGGQYFLTTRTTIFASGKDNMLARMIDGELPLLKDQKGNIVIDRDGTCFQYILNFLRDGSLLFPTDQHFLQLLLREARYYCVTGLVQHLELKIVHAADLPAFISVIRSEEELDRAVEATRHGLPALRLVLSRGNNKFSYVSNADERLLDNHELFLKLTTKFRNRITFLFETGNRAASLRFILRVLTGPQTSVHGTSTATASCSRKSAAYQWSTPHPIPKPESNFRKARSTSKP